MVQRKCRNRKRIGEAEFDKFFCLFTSFISSLKSEERIDEFLREVMTSDEINKIAKRFLIAKYLVSGKSYTRINTETGAGYDTISSVRKWLSSGNFMRDRKVSETKLPNSGDKSESIYLKKYAFHSALWKLFSKIK